jgi:hypothetical protein
MDSPYLPKKIVWIGRSRGFLHSLIGFPILYMVISLPYTLALEWKDQYISSFAWFMWGSVSLTGTVLGGKLASELSKTKAGFRFYGSIFGLGSFYLTALLYYFVKLFEFLWEGYTFDKALLAGLFWLIPSLLFGSVPAFLSGIVLGWDLKRLLFKR